MKFNEKDLVSNPYQNENDPISGKLMASCGILWSNTLFTNAWHCLIRVLLNIVNRYYMKEGLIFEN